jgi:hypothetical protein
MRSPRCIKAVKAEGGLSERRSVDDLHNRSNSVVFAELMEWMPSPNLHLTIILPRLRLDIAIKHILPHQLRMALGRWVEVSAETPFAIANMREILPFRG